MASKHNKNPIPYPASDLNLNESYSNATDSIIRVNIKFSDSQSFRLSVEPLQTIGEIKKIVGEEAKLPPRSVNLVFAGQLLKDCKTVEDCGLGGHTTLHAFCCSDDGMGTLDASHDTACNSLKDSNQGNVCNSSHQVSRDTENITEFQIFGAKKGKDFSPNIFNRLRGTFNFVKSEEDLSCLFGKSEINILDKYTGFNRFFVFCKLCNCVRPGLLRVVCKSCEIGLFVVNYGPSCWDDISSSTTLKGKCKNKNCASETPRFYLKCSQRHQGEEEGTAAALCHVQSNCRRVECITCQDIESPVLIFPCPPGHVMCLECFRLYAISALKERRFVEHESHGYTLPCPADCENSFIEDNHHFLLMGHNEYERFKNFGAEEFVLKNGGVLCPAPNCGMGMFPDDDDRVIKCVECKFESCRVCKRAYHFDSCQESLLLDIHNPSYLSVDRERAERASWECQSLKLIGEISKACPGCATKTERNGMGIMAPFCITACMMQTISAIILIIELLFFWLISNRIISAISFLQALHNIFGKVFMLKELCKKQ